jgi:four helix bundle protein
MRARRLEDLVAYQFARELCDQVYALLARSPRAKQDLEYHEQIADSASGVARTIAEGYARKSPGDFANFLRFSLGSIEETRDALRDGVARSYFTSGEIASAMTWVGRCERITVSLRASQLRLVFAARRREALARAQRRSRRTPPGAPPAARRRHRD